MLLRPVVEEFFFRGVLYQGAVAFVGTRLAVVTTTLLFGLARFAFGLIFGAYAAVSFGAQALLEGTLLGCSRAASGSLLPPILLHAALQITGIAAVSLASTLPVPGFNAPGDHTSAELIGLCSLSILLGLLLMFRSRPDAEPGAT